jgi:hypothetical protein
VRFVLLFVLLGILGVANFAYAVINDTPVILEKPAGELLYISAFDGFLDEWQVYTGQQSAQIVDDTMQLDVTSAGQATWSVAQPIFADFDVTIKTEPIAGPIDNAYGVVFRLQSGADQACDLPWVILCGIGDMLPIFDIGIRQIFDSSGGASSINYYAFLISSDGYYTVKRVIDGEEQNLSAWIQSPVIRQNLNAQNTVRVVARGAHFQFFINGEQVLLCIPNDPTAQSTYYGGECVDGTMQGVLTDASLAYGQLGVMTQSTITGGGGVTVQFDDVRVFSPSDNISGGQSNA